MKIFLFVFIAAYWQSKSEAANAWCTPSSVKLDESECAPPYIANVEPPTMEVIWVSGSMIEFKCASSEYRLSRRLRLFQDIIVCAFYKGKWGWTDDLSTVSCLPVCKNTTDHLPLTRRDEIDVTRDVTGDGQYDIVIKSCSSVDGNASETTVWPCNKDGLWPLALNDYHLRTTIENDKLGLCKKNAAKHGRTQKKSKTAYPTQSGLCMSTHYDNCTGSKKIAHQTLYKECKTVRRIPEGGVGKFQNSGHFFTCAKASDGSLQLKLVDAPVGEGLCKLEKDPHGVRYIEESYDNVTDLGCYGKWMCQREHGRQGKVKLVQYEG